MNHSNPICQRFRAAEERFEAAKEVYEEGLITDEEFADADYFYTKERFIREVSGYIYVIKAAHLCKIGRTRDIKDRLNNFYFMLPIPFKLVGLLKFEDALEAESHFHKKFASKRVKGEWFKLSPKDIRYFKRLKGDMKLDV